MTEVKFRRKKLLTKAALKLQVDKPVYVLIMSKIHEGSQRGKAQVDSDGKPKKPPMICDIIDLDTGEDCALICAEIIKTELTETYPNDSYVGKGFEITKQKRKEGKRYDPYGIAEIEVPAEFATQVDAAIKSLVSVEEPPAVSSAPAKQANRR